MSGKTPTIPMPTLTLRQGLPMAFQIAIQKDAGLSARTNMPGNRPIVSVRIVHPSRWMDVSPFIRRESEEAGFHRLWMASLLEPSCSATFRRTTVADSRIGDIGVSRPPWANHRPWPQCVFTAEEQKLQGTSRCAEMEWSIYSIAWKQVVLEMHRPGMAHENFFIFCVTSGSGWRMVRPQKNKSGRIQRRCAKGADWTTQKEWKE